MIKSNLCKCNMCDSILFDENPQINAPEYLITGNELSMIWNVEEEAWVCPICDTDDNLTDEVGNVYDELKLG